MPIDHPDWLDVVGGGWRYVGSAIRTVAATATAVTLLNQERAILIKVPGTPAEGRVFTVTVVSHTGGVITLTGVFTGGSLVLAYVNPALELAWDVVTSTPAAGADNFYFFTDTGLAVIDIASKGHQLAEQSIPVTLAIDDYPLGVEPRILGVQVSATNPLYVQDVAVPRRLAYDDQRTNSPAANTAATVTFPATVGRAWILDFAQGELFAVAAAAGSASFTVVDGAATIYSVALEIPNVANSKDRETIGPMAAYKGSQNTAMIVSVGAGGVGVSGRVNAGAYLYP